MASKVRWPGVTAVMSECQILSMQITVQPKLVVRWYLLNKFYKLSGLHHLFTMGLHHMCIELMPIQLYVFAHPQNKNKIKNDT